MTATIIPLVCDHRTITTGSKLTEDGYGETSNGDSLGLPVRRRVVRHPEDVPGEH